MKSFQSVIHKTQHAHVCIKGLSWLEDVVDPSADGTTAEGYYNYNNYYQDQAAYNNY